jgi:protocatechuate 3,4-dioxygenase beta subunit
MILAIGLTRRLITTVFFADTSASMRDPVLDCVADPQLRERMLARRANNSSEGGNIPVYRYDIVTRGEGETPFFVD